MTRREFLAMATAAPLALRQQSDAWGPGTHALGLGSDRDGLVYLPKGYQSGKALPLMVVLHGAGGSAQRFAERWLAYADEFNFIVLGIDSRDPRTWDMILGEYGPDVEFIADALALTRKLCAVDNNNMTLAGFSDGASYSLSFGIGAGVFKRIIAFSPGIMEPQRAVGKPPIFISHGKDDNILPISVTSRVFVPRLEKLGYVVTYKEFEGRHQIPDDIARAAMDWAFPKRR
jgi:phospholipase/carboxylesterase